MIEDDYSQNLQVAKSNTRFSFSQESGNQSDNSPKPFSPIAFTKHLEPRDRAWIKRRALTLINNSIKKRSFWSDKAIWEQAMDELKTMQAEYTQEMLKDIYETEQEEAYAQE